MINAYDYQVEVFKEKFGPAPLEYPQAESFRVFFEKE